MLVRVGVIGCGRWGQHYLRLIADLPDCAVVAMSDPDETQLKRARERHPEAYCSTDPSDLLRRHDLDAVVIATPAATHYPLVKQAINEGKHVLVEKPFVLDEAEGRELSELAAARSMTLMVGYVFLYNPGVRKLKEYMSSDRLGDLYYLYATRTNLGPIRADVNALWDLAPHDIAIFSYLIQSEPLYVNAVGSGFLSNGREDVVFTTLTYANGVVGHIHVSWANPHRVREIAVVGSRKRLVFDDLNPLEKVRVYEKGVEVSGTPEAGFDDFVLSVRDGDIISPTVEVAEPLRRQFEDFLRAVRDGVPPVSDAAWGLAGVRILTAAQLSLENGGARVEVGSA